MPYEFFIAKRYLKSKRKTRFISLITYISIAGVVIGVAALIIVLSVMNGFESEVRSRIIGFDAHIRLRTFHDQGISDYKGVMDRIRGLRHIVGLSPYILGKAIIESKNASDGIVVKGADQITLTQTSDLGKNIIFGELKLGKVRAKDGKELPGIILGYNLADRLVVSPGDRVVITSPSGVSGLLGPIPRVRQFCVTGFFETGMFEYDDTFALISIKEAQKLFKMGDKVSGIEIKLDDMDKAGAVAGAINRLLGYPYQALSWFQMHKNLFSWMQIEKWAMFIVLSLIIMVAAFNIVSTLIMVVMEKTKEIGILKSMGATSRSIMKIFMFEGLVVGVLGTVFGCVIGYGLCWAQKAYKFFSLPPDVYFINTLPILMKGSDFILVSMAAMGLCFLATLYPSWKAAKLIPVEAIRYE